MTKPFRNNAGIALFNSTGQVFIARRYRNDGPEIIHKGLEWQMPQGGIGDQEAPRTAAFRELFEETGVSKAEYLAETEWITYDFPPYFGSPSHRLAKYRGERQKWVALRVCGKDDEINVLKVRNAQPPEFDMWRWERLAVIANIVVPFKRHIYFHVMTAFSRFAAGFSDPKIDAR